MLAQNAYLQDYTSFQEGASRFDMAMQGIPDRVPIYAQLHEFAARQLGLTAREFYSTPGILTHGILEISEMYGIDLAYIDYDVYNIEAEALGQAMIWADEGMPDVDRAVPLITGPDDLSKIKTPDFDTTGRCPRIIEAQYIFQELTGLEPALQFCAPFSLVANIRGIEQLFFDIYDIIPILPEVFLTALLRKSSRHGFCIKRNNFQRQ